MFATAWWKELGSAQEIREIIFQTDDMGSLGTSVDAMKVVAVYGKGKEMGEKYAPL